MYVATLSAWKPNVNKGLVWILCFTHKCRFITFWLTVSNSETHTGGPGRTNCCYYSAAWTLANICVVGEMMMYSNTAFEMLVPLGYHRSDSSGFEMRQFRPVLVMSSYPCSVSELNCHDVSSQIIDNSLCSGRSTKLKSFVVKLSA